MLKTALSRLALLFAIIFLATSLAAAQAEQQAPAANKFDRSQMESMEDKSEVIAGQFHEISVATRGGNMKDVLKYFSPSMLVTPMPTEATRSEAEVKWIEHHGWKIPEARKLSVDEVVKSWSDFLGHFSEVEDLRFKLAESTFDAGNTTGKGVVSFYLVGREKSNKREWVRGEADTTFKQVDGKWMIEEMKFTKLDSLLATIDIFSEVSGPAGVAIQLPPGPPALNLWHGAAAADINGDGYIDICVTSDSENYLYINDGNGHFHDIAAEVGIKVTPTVSSPLFIDIDNDGDLDIFFCAFGKQMLFLNEQKETGKLNFRDISQEAGVALDAYSYSAAAGDINNDGLPDIYVTSYNIISLNNLQNSLMAATNGTPNYLFVNQGNGKFREMAKEMGVEETRWSFTAEFIDFDGDGDQDLFVVNDFNQNALYKNELKETGKTHFHDVLNDVGLKGGTHGMGVSFGDYNNDGKLDVHIAYMTSVEGDRIFKRVPGDTEVTTAMKQFREGLIGDRIFEGKGDGTFKDVTKEIGPLPAGWAWGGTFIDIDNDGWQDTYSQNGFVSVTDMRDVSSIQWRGILMSRKDGMARDKEAQELKNTSLKMFSLMLSKGYSLAGYERDFLALNLGGKKFLNISGVSGIDSVTDGRGAIYADFDNDGDLDVFLTNLQKTPHLLFKNNIGQDGNWLRITLRGSKSGTDAFGAIVKVKSALGLQTKVKAGGEGFMSQHDPRLLFGLGADKKVESIEVTWPSGLKQKFENFEAGSSLLITEGQDKPEKLTERRASLPDAKRPQAGATSPAN